MKDWVYHVTTLNKLKRYEQLGFINPPVRAWKTLEAARRFSIQTGRKVILRMLLRNTKQLEGHRGEAIFTEVPVNFPEEAN